MKKFRLAVVEDNPVHYRVPIYREINKSKKIEYKVYFCTLDDGSKRYQFNTSKKGSFVLGLEKIKFELLKNYFPFSFDFVPKNLWKMWNLGIVAELIRNKYDAVLIYGYSSTAKKLAYIGALLSGTPIIFREEIHQFLGGRIKNFIKFVLFKYVLFRLPSAFLPSYTMSKNFYHRMGVPLKRLFMHPCAVDNEFYQGVAASIDKKKTREEFGIPATAFVFLSVGTIDERKDCKTTIEAFERLGKKDSYLIFLGAGPEEEKLKEYCSRNGLSTVLFVKFSHDHREVSKYYKIADVFVLASREDVCPKTLNEALNFSLAALVSDRIGTGPDLVHNGVNGFSFPYHDVSALSNLMNELYSDRERTKKMGKKSVEIVSKSSLAEDIRATERALEFIGVKGGRRK